jgi:altered-inheritance-of-mitochondria protein 13
VTDEIEKLKKALGERKVMKDLPKEVEQARQGVISCLRLNDRQSLDCWQEVELFKREVRKLEEQFVGRVL